MPLWSTEMKSSEHPCAQQLCKSGCGRIKQVLSVFQRNRRRQLSQLFHWRGNLMPLACPLRVAGQQVSNHLPKYNSGTDIF